MLWHSAVPSIEKPKVSKFLRARRPPEPAAQSRPRRRRPPRPSHGLVCLSPGRPHPQTTSLGASRQPCVSAESDVLRWLSTGLLCSDGTAHPPLAQPHRSKYFLMPPGRSNIHNRIFAAFLRDHIHRKRLPRPSCGIIRTGSPGSPLPSPRPRPQQLAQSRPCKT